MRVDGQVCSSCGYLLRGLIAATRCPECGTAIDAEEVVLRGGRPVQHVMIMRVRRGLIWSFEFFFALRVAGSAPTPIQAGAVFGLLVILSAAWEYWRYFTPRCTFIRLSRTGFGYGPRLKRLPFFRWKGPEKLEVCRISSGRFEFAIRMPPHDLARLEILGNRHFVSGLCNRVMEATGHDVAVEPEAG